MIKASGRRTSALAALLGVTWIVVVPDVAQGQAGSVSHFVGPRYPPLARQAMISGRVVLRLAVGADGKLIDINEEVSQHPLLAQEAKLTVQQWEFHPGTRKHSVSVSVYFSFSGTTREFNPATVIKADFAASTVRVFVTTDAVPTVRP